MSPVPPVSFPDDAVLFGDSAPCDSITNELGALGYGPPSSLNLHVDSLPIVDTKSSAECQKSTVGDNMLWKRYSMMSLTCVRTGFSALLNDMSAAQDIL